MTSAPPSTLADGAYARKQIFSRSRLVAWSHGSRFRTAVRLVAPAHGGRLLDYGCGDGTFAALVHDRFSSIVGTDADAEQLAGCARRLRHLGNVAFVPRAVLFADSPRHLAAFDAVTCMEVLEHCVTDVRHAVLEDLRRLVAPTGRVVISVPIEVGASLLAKQTARRLAAWRRIGDYAHSERYTWPELARMVLLSGRAAIPRPTYRGGSNEPYHGHKGFDWRMLTDDVQSRFAIESVHYSPMPMLRSLLNSQVWMVCRPR